MQAVILQHSDFEGSGAITDWLARHHFTAQTIHLGHGQHLPAPLAAELAVIMGGPMSANDTARFPWLADEREWLRTRATADRPTLGVCLGAQQLAAALGAGVHAAAHKEIGWFDVYAAGPGTGRDIFRFPTRLHAFHWHGDTFQLPPGAHRLASSAACPEQGFQLGRHVIGLQCHLEVTPTAVAEMCQDGAEEIAAGGAWVQSASAMTAAPAAHYAAIHATLDAVLTHLVTDHDTP